jgi:hypothetical protein
MSDYYELIGQTVVPVDGGVLEWAQKLEATDPRVAHTRVLGMCDVSTIFIGLDHAYGRGGPPLLFETMAFWPGRDGYEQERCSTWLEAQEQHARMCGEVARPRAVLAYVGRCLQDRWYQAKRDLGRRWREMRGVELSEHEKQLDAIEDRIFDREDW